MPVAKSRVSAPLVIGLVIALVMGVVMAISAGRGASVATDVSTAAQTRASLIVKAIVFAPRSSVLTNAQKMKLRRAVAQVKASGSNTPRSQRLVLVSRASGTCAVARGDVRCAWRTLASQRGAAISSYVRSRGYRGTIKVKLERVPLIRSKASQNRGNSLAGRTATASFVDLTKNYSFTLENDTGSALNPSVAAKIDGSWNCSAGVCTGSAAKPTSATPTVLTGKVLIASPSVKFTFNSPSSAPTYRINATKAQCPFNPEEGPTPGSFVFTCVIEATGAHIKIDSGGGTAA